MQIRYTLIFSLGVFFFFSACGRKSSPDAGISSYLEGRLTVSAEIDSISDYRDFEVLVASQQEGDIDTLGFAVTDSTGYFSLKVSALEEGIYPLFFSRRGTMLGIYELAVADSDSVSVSAEFPMGNRLLRLRSPENAAWLAYKNVKAIYDQNILRLIQEEAYDDEVMGRTVGQTSNILWSLRETFPGTIGSDLASAESVVMLAGWNDSLLVVRAREVAQTGKDIIEVARAARRAEARLEGQEAALQLIRSFQEMTEDMETRAALHSEIVLAHIDSLEREPAIQTANEMKERYPGSQWLDWADRVLYEMENLSPGMPAPLFEANSVTGETVSLAGFQGRIVVLEFYTPGGGVFETELEGRQSLVEASDERDLAYVSISVEPDTLINEGFLEERAFPGIQIIDPEGPAGGLSQLYNINVLPTRVLIDRAGNIVKKYIGGAMLSLHNAVLQMLEEEPASS